MDLQTLFACYEHPKRCDRFLFLACRRKDEKRKARTGRKRKKCGRKVKSY